MAGGQKRWHFASIQGQSWIQNTSYLLHRPASGGGRLSWLFSKMAKAPAVEGWESSDPLPPLLRQTRTSGEAICPARDQEHPGTPGTTLRKAPRGREIRRPCSEALQNQGDSSMGLNCGLVACCRPITHGMVGALTRGSLLDPTRPTFSFNGHLHCSQGRGAGPTDRSQLAAVSVQKMKNIPACVVSLL